MNGTWTGICAASVFTFAVIGPIAGPGAECVADDFVHLSGKHIKLTTDIDDAASNADLIAAFDAAVGQWETFWQFPKGTLDGFQVDACVIRDKERFALAGLIPANVPNFPYGFALQNRVWVVAQKSDYYTRHLLLHEGVHALAFAQFGGTGPSWFMEGTAEMLAVHQGAGADTIVNRVPVDRESVPFWGRFKVMSESRRAQSIPTLAMVLGYPRDMQSDVNSYGWSWAAVMMLHAYPDTRDAFHAAARNGTRRSAVFNNDLRRELQIKWPVVVARWQLMCHDLDYGFDWSREQVQLSMNDQVWDGNKLSIDVAANRGWQSVGVRLEKGMKVNLLPSGQCTLADQPKPWVSEPTGVTIRYHNGRPLGRLIACLLPSPSAAESTSPRNLKPLQVAAITRPAQVPIKENCWLLFRVNDAPGELADNTGGYRVQITSPANSK